MTRGTQHGARAAADRADLAGLGRFSTPVLARATPGQRLSLRQSVCLSCPVQQLEQQQFEHRQRAPVSPNEHQEGCKLRVGHSR